MKEIKWIKKWFDSKGWEPRNFQLRAWEAYLRGENGLVSVSTGFGKTYAGCLAAMAEMAHESKVPGIQILYITPLRALSTDILKSLQVPVEELKLPFRVESRTGDTSQSERSKQKNLLLRFLLQLPNLLTFCWHRKITGKRSRIVASWLWMNGMISWEINVEFRFSYVWPT